MPAALASFADQARSLQRLLHPRVAQLNAMLLLQLLVEMPYVEVVIAFPVQAQYLLAYRQRYPLRAHYPFAPIRQPVIAVLF